MADVPNPVVTVTLTVPVPAGAVRTILPAVSEVYGVGAGSLPKSTAVAEARPVPIIVTLVPPAGNPVRGETEAITGGPVAAPEGATPTTVNATPKVPRHRPVRAPPLRNAKNSQPTSSTTPWSLHSSPWPFDLFPATIHLKRTAFMRSPHLRQIHSPSGGSAP